VPAVEETRPVGSVAIPAAAFRANWEAASLTTLSIDQEC
jgi:hypothetical protein